MPIAVSKLQFGEIDAKNEVFQQTRYGSSVFENSFQIPPKVNIDDLIRGARFFVSGQKGCGKTALLLHIQKHLDSHGANTYTILFKSGISETERARIATGIRVGMLDTGHGLTVEYDYTVNWLWFIYKNLVRLIELDKVLEGKEIVRDLRKLLGVDKETKISTFADLAISKLRGTAKAGLNSGPFTAEINGEVEAVKHDTGDRLPLEVIEICERYLPKVVMYPRSRCALFFDELELFWNRPDQRERDLFLIRDLLQSVARVNRALGAKSSSFVIYASVRSEVMEEVNRVGPEL